MAATKDDIKALQESLNALLKMSTNMTTEIEQLKQENRELRASRDLEATRISANKQKWTEMNTEAKELLQKMMTVKEELKADGIENDYFTESSVEVTSLIANLFEENMGKGIDLSAIKAEPEDIPTLVPFTGTGREERLEIQFGLDGDCSAVALRRFIDRFKVIKAINMKNQLVGWDSAIYRADKLKLGLTNEPFDYVSFENAMAQEWTKDDNLILEKLKDKYMNTQAIEMNILTFEKATQEQKEDLGEFIMRLRRSVREAYDGEHQEELDKRVAWKFVSGVSDKQITRKLMESGWMKDRHSAKPLEELLKIAEVARQTDEAIEVIGKEKHVPHVSAFQSLPEEHEVENISAFVRPHQNKNNLDRGKTSSGESKSSYSSGNSASSSGSNLPIPMKECWYCKKKHRGGWFLCTKRKNEDPSWKPGRNKASKDNTKQDFRE